MATAPALGHHDLYVAPWRGGTTADPSIVTGYDVVRFQGNRIKDVYVLLEAAPK